MTAFKARFKQLGGKIKYETTYQDRPSAAQRAERRTGINAHKADVVVTVHRGCLRRSARSSRVCGRRTTMPPVLNSWAGDGTYWLPAELEDLELLVRHLRELLSALTRTRPWTKLAKQVKAGYRRLRRRPSCDRRARDRDQPGARLAQGLGALAAVMVKFKHVKTLSGNVSFTTKRHTVFGRAYRVIEINNNVPHEKGTVTAKVVPNSPDS